MRLFALWCEERKLCPLPCSPKVLGTYISYLAKRNYKRSTMQCQISAVSQAHALLGYPEPSRSVEFKRIWNGIRRSKPSDRVSCLPLTIDLLRQVVQVIPYDFRGLRDRALILTGFTGTLTAGELLGLRREDIVFDEHMIISIGVPRERQVYVSPGLHSETCPVQAMRAWLEISNIQSGPVFRFIHRYGGLQPGRLSLAGPRHILLKRCREAGLDARRFGIQSLRSGFYISAARNNIGIEHIARHAGIKHIQGLRDRHLAKSERWSDDLRSINRPKSPGRHS
jgi:integrase